MEFVVSMTHRIEELEQIVKLWSDLGDSRDPFKRTIFTPLFARPNVLSFMCQHFKGRSEIMFDSGGYCVQQGIVRYEELYQRLMDFYNENRWASWYVLPDYVPTSGLTPGEVERRVTATVTVSKLFHAEMPDELRPFALPVVQGHTLEQIEYCLGNYADLGVTYVGFGSFGTSGNNNSINMVTSRAIQMVEFLKHQADERNLKVHLFGIGTPSVLPLFHDLGVDSFDSSCWSRTAGYGNVYLPFRGRKSISNRMAREIGGPAYTRAEFSALKDMTGHDCPFCQDIEALESTRIYQMMHNLRVILDTVDALNSGESLYPELIGLRASRYRELRAGRIYRPLQLGRGNE